MRIVLMDPRQKMLDSCECLRKWGSGECLHMNRESSGVSLGICWSPADRGEECCRMILLTPVMMDQRK